MRSFKLQMAAALAVVVLVVAACGSSTTPSASTAANPSAATSGAPASGAPASAAAAPINLVLRYCWSGEGEVKAMESIIQDWNAANPDIQVRGISGSINVEEIAASVAGGAPPDMVIACNNQMIPGFAAEGVIEPMDDLLTQIKADTSNIIPASLEWVKFKDKLYGLPFLQDVWGFMWNTDAFTEAGLDPTKPPTTLEELESYNEKLTKVAADGTVQRAGFIPYYPGKNFNEISHLFGCEYYDKASNKLTVNSDACVQFFDWYKAYAQKYDKDGKITDLIASKGSEDEDLFYTGKVAMGIFGEWVPGAAYAPTFAPNLKYDSAPIPSKIADFYGGGFINGNAFFIPKGSKDKVAAAKFGMYLMTDPPSKKMALQNASVPQLVSLTTDPDLTAIPHFKAFLDIANNKNTWSNPMISIWAELSDSLDAALDKVINGGADSKQVLDDVVTQLQPKLDEAGG
jgi:multiple sugar transport system substrate-binding protein